MAAYRLPKESEADKARRQLAVQSALKAATETPLRCARLCAEVIKLCCQAAAQGNPNAVIDAGVGALAAYAALRGCALSVAANLRCIFDRDFVRACQGELEQLANQTAAVEALLAELTARFAP
jgi:formiminotetrahydrofolate cyclodeaminase